MLTEKIILPKGIEVMMVSRDVRQSVNCPFVNALYACFNCSRRPVTLSDSAGSVFTVLAEKMK